MAPPRQWEVKQQVIQEGDKEKDDEMSFQDAKRVLKKVYDHSHSDTSTDERRKQPHVMYSSSWDITSRCVVQTHRQDAVPHDGSSCTSAKSDAPPQVDGDVHQL
jgi:hypothetical protein